MAARLRAAGLVVALVVVTYAPVFPLREARAALLLVLLLAARLTMWSSRPRALAMAAVLLSVVATRLHPRSWYLVLTLFAAGEAIEWIAGHPDLWRPAITTVAVLGIVVALHGIVQAFNLDPWTCEAMPQGGCFPDQHNLVQAFLGNRDLFGAFVALSAPAVAMIAPWGLLALAPALVVGRAVTPIVALAVTVLVLVTLWSLSRWSRWMVLGVTVAAVIGYVGLVDAPGTERFAVWQQGVTLTKVHWLVGAGPSAWWYEGVTAVRTGTSVWREAHNEYLQWAFEMGLAGSASLAWYAWTLVRGLAQLRPSALKTFVIAVLIITAVEACGHFVLHVAATGAIALIALGIAEGLVREAGLSC